MFDAATYSALEELRDGRSIEIRALTPDDQADLLAAVSRASAQSLFRRFFVVKRRFAEEEIAFFLNVDFVHHVGLVAVMQEGDQREIVAGGRYFVLRPEAAEVAFIVVDEYQGLGIGTSLLRHLATIAREGGLQEFVAEVLPENIPMLRLFEKSGFPISVKRDATVVRVALRLDHRLPRIDEIELGDRMP